MPVRDVMMVAGWSFRPPRKTQILFFLFLLALEHFFLFVNSFRFCNLWLWWSRAEGAAVCCCGLASKVTEVWRLWRTHRLIVVRFFLFSIFPCLFAVLFSIFYVKDGKWSFSIVMERHCGSRLLLSFLPKINWTAWAWGRHVFFYYNHRLRWWKRSALTSFHSRQRPPLSPCFPQFLLFVNNQVNEATCFCSDVRTDRIEKLCRYLPIRKSSPAISWLL